MMPNPLYSLTIDPDKMSLPYNEALLAAEIEKIKSAGESDGAIADLYEGLADRTRCAFLMFPITLQESIVIRESRDIISDADYPNICIVVRSYCSAEILKYETEEREKVHKYSVDLNLSDTLNLGLTDFFNHFRYGRGIENLYIDKYLSHHTDNYDSAQFGALLNAFGSYYKYQKEFLYKSYFGIVKALKCALKENGGAFHPDFIIKIWGQRSLSPHSGPLNELELLTLNYNGFDLANLNRLKGFIQEQNLSKLIITDNDAPGGGQVKINNIQFQAMIANINRIPTDIDKVKKLLDDTFLKQLANPADEWKVFTYFKFMLENIEHHTFGNGKKLKIKAPADKIVADWIAQKEKKYGNAPQVEEQSIDTMPTTSPVQNYKYDSTTITAVYNFCINTDVFAGSITATKFLEYIDCADLSRIYKERKTIKSKLKYIIYILSNIITNEDNCDWYKVTATSVGATKGACSGANISDDKWKNAAKALK